MSNYKTAIGVAYFVSFIGGIAVFAGAGLSFWLVSEGDLALLGLPSAITVALIGLLLVICGQASRAVMDNANHSREILEQMRKNT